MPVIPTILYDPNRGFRTWHISEIYMGPDEPSGNVVPNVNDMVVDWTHGFYRVTKVDTTISTPGEPPSYKPTLVLFDPYSIMSHTTLDAELPFWMPTMHERAFYNGDVFPKQLVFDGRFRIFGAESTKYKVYLGHNPDDTAVPISAVYDAVGNITSDTYTLEPIDPSNLAIKRPKITHVNVGLTDGADVTLVSYAEDGTPTGIYPFIVINSDTIRPLEMNTKFITDITLNTSYLDTTEPDLLVVPNTVQVTGSDFVAQLHYSDGSVEDYPIDGLKCKLHGLDNFDTNVVGVKHPIVLSYYPDINEPAININTSPKRVVSRLYHIKIVSSDIDKIFRVFLIPEYSVSLNQFIMKFYLGKVDYSFLLPIPESAITLSRLDSGDNSNIITTRNSPTQTLRVVVDLGAIITTRVGQTHVDTITVSFGDLLYDGSTWDIDYMNTGTDVLRGRNHASFSNTAVGKPILVGTDYQSKGEWIDNLYTKLHVPFDTSVRMAPPIPTHFTLSYDGLETADIPVEDWNLPQSRISGNWIQYETIMITWKHIDSVSGDVQHLGVSPIMALQDY